MRAVGSYFLHVEARIKELVKNDIISPHNSLLLPTQNKYII